MVSEQYRVLVVVAVAELSAMSLWFSATAAAPELASRWALTASETAWLTIAFQVGFVGVRSPPRHSPSRTWSRHGTSSPAPPSPAPSAPR